MCGVDASRPREVSTVRRFGLCMLISCAVLLPPAVVLTFPFGFISALIALFTGSIVSCCDRSLVALRLFTVGCVGAAMSCLGAIATTVLRIQSTSAGTSPVALGLDTSDTMLYLGALLCAVVIEAVMFVTLLTASVIGCKAYRKSADAVDAVTPASFSEPVRAVRLAADGTEIPVDVIKGKKGKKSLQKHPPDPNAESQDASEAFDNPFYSPFQSPSRIGGQSMDQIDWALPSSPSVTTISSKRIPSGRV